MTTLYSDRDYVDALGQYKKIKLFYVFIAVFYTILMVAGLVWYISLPFNSDFETLVKMLVSAVTAGFIIFSFPYCGIKIHRVRAYVKMLKNISEGIKEKGTAYFSHIDDWETKDRVDVNVLVFKKWNNKKQEWDYLNVYVDAEKDVPDFKENEEIFYITEGNVLLSYEKTGNSCENK